MSSLRYLKTYNYPEELKLLEINKNSVFNKIDFEFNETIYKNNSTTNERVKNSKFFYYIIKKCLYKTKIDSPLQFNEKIRRKLIFEERKNLDFHYNSDGSYYTPWISNDFKLFLNFQKRIDKIWTSFHEDLLLNLVKEKKLNIQRNFLLELIKSNHPDALKLISLLKSMSDKEIKRGIYKEWEKLLFEYVSIKMGNKTKYNYLTDYNYFPSSCFFCGRDYFDFSPYIMGLCNVCDCLAFRSGFLKFKSKTEMLIDLKNLYDLLGYIPPAKEDYFGSKDFIEEFIYFSEDKKKQVLAYLIEILPYGIYKMVFSNWFTALVHSGILNQNARKTSRGTMCLSKDNHLCLSLAEKKIDDWLFDHKILHEKEPLYPKEKDLNPNGFFRADWKVDNSYIEFFGLKGQFDYDEKIKIKKMICKNKNIILIEIYENDLKDLSIKLGILKN